MSITSLKKSPAHFTIGSIEWHIARCRTDSVICPSNVRVLCAKRLKVDEQDLIFALIKECCPYEYARAK